MLNPLVHPKSNHNGGNSSSSEEESDAGDTSNFWSKIQAAKFGSGKQARNKKLGNNLPFARCHHHGTSSSDSDDSSTSTSSMSSDGEERVNHPNHDKNAKPSPSTKKSTSRIVSIGSTTAQSPSSGSKRSFSSMQETAKKATPSSAGKHSLTGEASNQQQCE